jgi:hypothetical protein
MLCSLARWHLSNRLDRGGEPAGWAHRHVAHCTACDRFAQRLLALHGRLTSEAATAPVPPAIARPRRVAPLVLAAAAVAGLIYVVLPRSTHAPAPPVVATDLHRPVAAPVPHAEPLASHALASANRWIDAAPLRDELSALTSDTVRGAHIALGPLGGIGLCTTCTRRAGSTQ